MSMSSSDFDSFSDYQDSGSEYLPSADDDNNVQHQQPRRRRYGIIRSSSDEGNDVEMNRPSTSINMSLQEKRKVSRKRLRNQAEWKREKAKSARARGLEYDNVKGNKVTAKIFFCGDCSCPKKCHTLLTMEQRKKIFDNFYGLGQYDLQTAFLFGNIKVIPKKRTYVRNVVGAKRQYTRIYQLPNENGDVTVCKTFFKKTLCVSDGRLTRILRNKLAEDNFEVTAPLDKRGKKSSINRTGDLAIQVVEDFIKKFPTYISHYSRANNPNRTYLAPNLSISKLYHLYSEEIIENKVSKFIFTKVFNEKFNLQFRQPHKDTCKKCDIYNIKLRTCVGPEKRNFEIERELHLRKAELARSNLKKDTKFGQQHENDTSIIAFDLMKTLPTPDLTTNEVYYKRQLWTYCFNIHDLVSNIAYMYIWHEGVASRGPAEIGSCLLHFVAHVIKTKKMIMYSDQCGGQNRNIKLAAICNYITGSDKFTLEQIDHKFLVSGHSFLPCDRDFGVIEKQRKYNTEIWVPDDWAKLIASAKKTEPKFQVIKMGSNDFRSTTNLEKLITNRKEDISLPKEDRTKIQWLKIQWLRYMSSNPYTIYYKYTNNDDDSCRFDSIDIEKKKTRHSANLSDIVLDMIYPNGRFIEKNKQKDLLSLLKYIPPIHHDFYNNLKTNETATDDEVNYHDQLQGDPTDDTV